MPGPVETISSMLEVAHEDSVCHKIIKMNISNIKYSLRNKIYIKIQVFPSKSGPIILFFC